LEPRLACPFTVYPLSSEDVADVTLGFVDVAVGLHLGELERALAAEGVEAAGGSSP